LSLRLWCTLVELKELDLGFLFLQVPRAILWLNNPDLGDLWLHILKCFIVLIDIPGLNLRIVEV